MQDQITSGTDSIQRLEPVFVAQHWEELCVYLKQLPMSPRGYRTEGDLNNLLANVLAGYSFIWLVVGAEGEVKLAAILSRGVNGPEGHSVMHIEGLMGFEKLPPEMFTVGMAAMQEHATRLGCCGFVAETQEKNVVALTEKLGWKSYPMYKLYKEL